MTNIRNMPPDLMRSVSQKSFPRRDEIGSKVVEVDGVKVRVGPEVINQWERMVAEKQAAIASGKPPKQGIWQTQDPKVKAQMKAVAEAAGFPSLMTLPTVKVGNEPRGATPKAFTKISYLAPREGPSISLEANKSGK